MASYKYTTEEQLEASRKRMRALVFELSKHQVYPNAFDALGHSVDALIEAVYNIKAAAAPGADTSALDEIKAKIDAVKAAIPIPE